MRRWSVSAVAVAILTLLSAPDLQAADDFRQVQFGLMGGVDLLIDGKSRSMVKQPWGGGIYAKLFPVNYMSIQFDAGYYIAFRSKTVSFHNLVRYKEVSALGTAPIMLGINYEIRPDKTFDPFIGLAGGIYYTIVTQTAQNVSNLGSNPVGATSMTSNDLLVKATKVLPAAAARLGLDIRPLRFITLMVWAQYSYTFDHPELVNDRLGTKKAFIMDNLGLYLATGLSF